MHRFQTRLARSAGLLMLGLALLLPRAGVLVAQNVSDLVISEAMATPDETSLEDDFGQREGWIEIYNTSTGTVNVGGCFLTDDRSDLKKSVIPKNDLRTQLGPRQVMLVYACGDGSRGTFYAGFTLKPGSTVYLVSNDGRTIVDSLAIPATLPAGQSVSKLPIDRKRLKWEAQTQNPVPPSPMVVNGSLDNESNAEHIHRTDPHGFILSIVAVSVVFSALAILWFLFWVLFERPAKRAAAPRPAKAVKVPAGNAGPDGEVAAAIAMALDMDSGGEEYAAISMALHLYLSEAVHDQESFVITIRPNPGSGWNRRGRNFRRNPR